MKLELKHLDFANNGTVRLTRLPHWDFENVNLKDCELSFNAVSKEPFLRYKNVTFGLDQIKVYKRQLSDLTKEIEHNGEKFVPMKVLFNDIIYDGHEDLENISVDTDNLYFEEKGICGYIHSANNTDYMNLYILNKKIIRGEHGSGHGGGRGSREFNYVESTWLNECLFKWHFDLFGLIDAGIAIDINTI